MKKYSFLCEFPSKSTPGKYYTVKLDEELKLSCSCSQWIYNRRGDRTCVHTDKCMESGFISNKGKIIIGKDTRGTKIPVICKKYPNCDACKLRFICYSSEKNPVFDIKELEKEHIIT